MAEKKYSDLTVIRRLWHMVRPVRGRMALCILGGVAGSLSVLVTLGAGAAFLCTLVGENMILSSRTWLIIMIVSAMMRGPCRFLEQYKGHDVAYSLLAIMRGDFYDQLRLLAPAKLEEKRNGELISTAILDIETIEAFFAHTIAPVFIAVITAVLSIIFCTAMWAPLGLIMLPLYLLVGVVIPVISNKIGAPAGASYRKSLGELKAFLIDSLRGIREILTLGRGQQRVEELNERGRAMNRLQHWLVIQKNIVTSLPDFVVMLSRILLMGICSAQMMKGNMTLGQASVLLVIIGASFTPVCAISGISGSLIQTFAAARRVFAIYDEPPQVNDPENPDDEMDPSADVDFQNVSFAYPGTGSDVLKGLNLEIRSGEHVALCGQSGCGKSTTLRLLLRFWDPTTGNITLGGKPLTGMHLAACRGAMTMVTQEVWLSGESIADNIRLGKPGAALEEIRTAAKKACIDETIMRLPRQYDTPAGELGNLLSGGERQRISIARALLRNSRILLLDEPTSSLDTLNEKEILRAIETQTQDETVIMVSHRMSAIVNCDRVLRMDAGRILKENEQPE